MNAYRRIAPSQRAYPQIAIRFAVLTTIILAAASQSRAAIIDIIATASGYGQDAGDDNSYETINGAANPQAVDTPTEEIRGVFEFALPANVAGATINSVMLRLTEIADSENDIIRLNRYGPADGSISAADMTRLAFAAVNDLSNGVVDVNLYDVTTSLGPALAAGQPWIGFRLQEIITESTLAYAVHGAFSGSTDSARLIVDYTPIPEPATIGLAICGAAALIGAGVRRNRRATIAGD